MKDCFDSRLKTTTALAEAIVKMTEPPEAFICTSATGNYWRGDMAGCITQLFAPHKASGSPGPKAGLEDDLCGPNLGSDASISVLNTLAWETYLRSV